MLLTRLPLYSQDYSQFLVRLACVRHAASVDSEPGSNSPFFLFMKLSIPHTYSLNRLNAYIQKTSVWSFKDNLHGRPFFLFLNRFSGSHYLVVKDLSRSLAGSCHSATPAPKLRKAHTE